MSELIVLAAFWNEADWISASLDQLDRLKPREAIICEGCFDPRFPVHSTDGTKSVVENWVEHRSWAKLIEPVRVKSKWELIAKTWDVGTVSDKWLCPNKLRTVGRSLLMGDYRTNQALSFNTMMNVSSEWECGRWFMTYDADQYYSDKVLERLSHLTKDIDGCLLLADELTFFDGYSFYTREYEKRKYNNMPHRIFPDTVVLPTRTVVRQSCWTRRRYSSCCRTQHLGEYFHYKFRSLRRGQQTYAVGDRERPNVNQYAQHIFRGEHPEVIRAHGYPLKGDIAFDS